MNNQDNRSLDADVSMDLTVECFGESNRSHRIDTVLGYSRRDAFAVAMTFLLPGGAVTWTFARDLLAGGVQAPVGEGDVLVAPGLSLAGHSVVHLDLRSPDGEILLEARTQDVTAFLARTFELVPAGTESSELDLDDLVRQLVHAEQRG